MNTLTISEEQEMYLKFLKNIKTVGFELLFIKILCRHMLCIHGYNNVGFSLDSRFMNAIFNSISFLFFSELQLIENVLLN
jgi:hypothetical protein